jgi:hypothetical protein
MPCIARAQAGRILATLVRLLGGFDLRPAEDLAEMVRQREARRRGAGAGGNRKSW